MRGGTRGVVAAGLVAVLAGTLAGQVPVGAQAAPQAERLTAQRHDSVDGHEVKATRPGPSRTEAAAKVRRPAPAWPTAHVAEVTVSAQTPAVDVAGVTEPPLTRATGTPVSVGPAPTTGRRGGAVTTNATVAVEVLPRSTAEAAGVPGLLLRLARADRAATAADFRVRVDYAAFRTAYGADWSSRLRLVALTDCAVVTQAPSRCTVTELPTDNDVRRSTVTANARIGTVGTYVAVLAGPSGGSGTFAESGLASSSTWSHGGATGGFNWSYPMRTPPAVGGPAPSVSLGYSSQSVDGRNAASNNQPSWIGEGFDFSPGFVERRYTPCADDMTGGSNSTETGDLCWDGYNAVLSIGGSSVELLRDANGRWHPRREDASRVELLTDSSFANGDNDNEYWKVTTADGTQYFFGRNRLPGWATDRPTTNSVLTVPVAGNHANEPCENGSFAHSFCTQAWRWNLDYVVDVHGNSMSLWWAKETNRYARNHALTSPVQYDRGGHLLRIDYGSDNRGGSEYAPTAPYVKNTPGRVEFGVSDRCLSNCATKDETTWPDTPWEQECTASTTQCFTGSPTFWTSKRLTTVTTKVWKAATSAYQNVDSWTLRHTFPDPGDGTRAGLWLAGITQRGLNGTTVTLPEVTLDGIQMNNRVDAAGSDHSKAMNWWRLNKIVNETGGETFVTYSPRECVRSQTMPASVDNNRMRCFPVYWTPQGQEDPIQDWFHKYVVREVKQYDHQGGGEPVVTTYEYQNPSNLPLWRYDDDAIVPAKRKSWSQWRGYPTVVTRVGEGAAQTKTETLYFRGMHGDRLSGGGTRSVTVTGLEGGAVTDHDHYAGMPREQITWLGSTVLAATVTDPWRSAATASRSGVPTVESRYVRPATTRTRVALDGGGWRRTTSTTTFDSYGMPTTVDDRGDDNPAVSDDLCTATEYARNTSGQNWLLTPVRRTHGWAGQCATAPTSAAQVTADTRFRFDGAAYGTAPTKGQVTAVEEISDYNGGSRLYQTVSTATYDAYGRTDEVTDVAGEMTKSTYTPATGGPVTRVTTTNPLGWTEVVDIDPAWGEPVKRTDANLRVTETGYDALGRTIGVWLSNRPRTSYPNDPSTGLSYTVSKSGPSSITTRSLNPRATYDTSYQIIDSLGRARQTQAPAYGGGRVLTETHYDSAGRVWKTNGPYFQSGTAGTTPYFGVDQDVARQVRTVFDAAGRPTNEILFGNAVEKWRSVTSYHGDHNKLTPPNGAAASTVWTDARGNTTKLWQHHGNTPTGGYDQTTYSYHPTGRLAGVADASGNTWSYEYDIRGRQIRVDDPDKGETEFTYNTLGDVETVTDSRGLTRAFTYDDLGRPTSVRDGSVTGDLRTSWTYDSPVKGITKSASRWVGTDEYRTETITVDAMYRPTQSRVVVPAAEGALAGTYTFRAGYNADGSLRTQVFPAAGGLATETVTTEYDQTYALPKLLATNHGGGTHYVVNAGYSQLYEPNTITRATALTGAKSLQTGQYYDETTGRVARRAVIRSVAPSYLANATFDYDHAGNVTKIDDNPLVDGSQRDTQCFTYDHQRRLTEAWTPASADCDQDPTVAGLGGQAPYWQSWDFGTATDPKGRVGNRLAQTDHATPTGDVTTTYTYPAAGANQPHSLLGYSRTDNTGTTTGSYAYDSAGNTTSRPGPQGQQTLTWDPEGHLATLTDTAGTNSYLYDVGGNRLISRDPTGTTLHLGDTELRLPNGSTQANATRYYRFNGEVIAQRTITGLTWLAGDHHGTGEITVSADANQTVTQRRHTPYGGPRGSQPTWPNQRGFVGGYQDPTGLTHLGAREYDPTTGRFVSVDPLIDVGDPQQIHGYSYAGNNPTTYSDPDGLIYTDFLNQPDPHFGLGQAGNCRGGYDCQDKADKGTYRSPKIKWGPPPSPTEQIVHESLCTLMIVCRPALFISDTADLYSAVESGDPAAIFGALAAYVPLCVGPICKKAADYIAERVQSMLGRSAKGAADSALNSASRRAADDAAERAAQRAGAPYVAPTSPKPPAPPRKPTGGSGPTTTKAKSGGPSCRHSFAPDTRVLLADGGTRRIDEVDEGDRVLAHDPETGRTSAEVVTELHINRDRELTDLVVRNEDGEFVTLETTQHHPFWSESREQWVDAGELRATEWLKTSTGEQVTVAKVRNFLGVETMRDLTVANVHTYYVLAGNTPVLVHNCTPGADKPGVPGGVENLGDVQMATDDALDTAVKFLGLGYQDMGDGRLLSADGLRQVRMTDRDTRHPTQNPHINFETYRNPIGPGRRSGRPVSNHHVYLPEEKGWHPCQVCQP
ncbi:polymorphic toxin-type HINT domain-containing protein [Micromonospora sp. NPDC050187]|uniref:polymorphic toxin-type HINT domain-containing protein n=1 Tax=Micromonospora sp. NPDC050187 TaxID=3364277 RepID=UPI0037AED5B3